VKDTYSKVYNSGTNWQAGHLFQGRLRSREPTFRNKTPPVPGLELSDLLARTAKCDVLADNGCAVKPSGDFTTDVVEILQEKYNRRRANNQVEGYGKALFTWPSVSKCRVDRRKSGLGRRASDGTRPAAFSDRLTTSAASLIPSARLKLPSERAEIPNGEGRCHRCLGAGWCYVRRRVGRVGSVQPLKPIRAKKYHICCRIGCLLARGVLARGEARRHVILRLSRLDGWYVPQD
jgi:hypothetical protein